jgi:putative membrane protein
MYKNKLLITASFLIITFSFFSITCARTREEGGPQRNIIEIGERMFATQVRDIYLNAEHNLGRTIKLEGIFRVGQMNESNIYYVIRFSQDGCCGGGMSGFEVKWTQNPIPYPADNSWVEATGILREQISGIDRYLYLELLSLTVLNRRGAEFVRQ